MRLLRGVVRSYDATNHKADVLLVGSMSRLVLAVPVAHHIPPYLIGEGAACGVAFFAEGSEGVVLCTFGGAPHACVTTYQGSSAGIMLTTGWQTLPDLSIEVAPPAPHTWTVIVWVEVNMRSMVGYADLTELLAQIAVDGSLVGTPACVVVTDAWEGSCSPLLFMESVVYSDPHTYTVQARKGGGTQTKHATATLMVITAFPST